MTKNIIIGLLILLSLALIASSIYWNTEAHRQESLAIAAQAEAEQQMLMSMQAAEASHMEALKQREIALKFEADLARCRANK